MKRISPVKWCRVARREKEDICRRQHCAGVVSCPCGDMAAKVVHHVKRASLMDKSKIEYRLRVGEEGVDVTRPRSPLPLNAINFETWQRHLPAHLEV
jgi:hypothetical protein